MTREKERRPVGQGREEVVNGRTGDGGTGLRVRGWGRGKEGEGRARRRTKDGEIRRSAVCVRRRRGVGDVAAHARACVRGHMRGGVQWRRRRRSRKVTGGPGSRSRSRSCPPARKSSSAEGRRRGRRPRASRCCWGPWKRGAGTSRAPPDCRAQAFTSMYPFFLFFSSFFFSLGAWGSKGRKEKAFVGVDWVNGGVSPRERGELLSREL